MNQATPQYSQGALPPVGNEWLDEQLLSHPLGDQPPDEWLTDRLAARMADLAAHQANGSSISQSGGDQRLQQYQQIQIPEVDPNRLSRSMHPQSPYEGSPYSDSIGNSNTPTSTNPYYGNPTQYAAPVPHSYAQPSYTQPYSASPLDPPQSQFRPAYLTTYSSLNGATSNTTLPSNDNSSNITIDPALVSLSPNMQSRYPPQPSQQQHQYPSLSPGSTTISPSSLHAAIPPPQSQYYNNNGNNNYAPSTSNHQQFPLQVHVEISPRPRPQKSLDVIVRELLSPRMLEKSPGPAATTLIDTLSTTGTGDTNPALRKEILNSMRDHASQDFYKVWAKSTTGLDILKAWLKAAATKSEWEETLMPLLHVLDRLPLDLDDLRAARMGRVLVKSMADPPSGAAKDMAIHLETKWRNMMPPPPPEKKKVEEDIRGKKRKVGESATKAPPSKKPTPASISTRRESIKVDPSAPQKVTKSDSSFFSAPKKPKLPSFKKVVKKETDGSVAQPMNIDPFQEALKAMAKGKPSTPVPPVGFADKPSNGTPIPSAAGVAGPSTMSKKRKKVSFRPDHELEAIKWIEKAIYDDDLHEGTHSLNDVKALDRAEGRALHIHLFEEGIDWYEPMVLEIPPELDIQPRGSNSIEAKVQEEREKVALMASYMSMSSVPDTPGELHPGMMDPIITDGEESQTKTMLAGDDIARLTDPAAPALNVNELLAQISLPAANATGAVSGNVTDGWQTQMNPAMLQGGLGLEMFNNVPPEAFAMMQQQMGWGQQPFGQDPSQQQQQNYWGGNTPDMAAQQQWGDGGNGGGWGDEGGYDNYGNNDFQKKNNRGGRGWRGRGGRGGGAKSKRLCNFFASGHCRYGESCDFFHDPNLSHIQRPYP